MSEQRDVDDRRVDGSHPIRGSRRRAPEAGAALVCQAAVGPSSCHGLSKEGHGKGRRKTCLAIRRGYCKSLPAPSVSSSGARHRRTWMRSPHRASFDPLTLAAAASWRASTTGDFQGKHGEGSIAFTDDLPEVAELGATAGDGTRPDDRGRARQPVRVEWIKRHEGTCRSSFPGRADETGADGVPVQCVTGFSGGLTDTDAAALPGSRSAFARWLTAAQYEGWAEKTSSRGPERLSATTRWTRRAAMLCTTINVQWRTRFTVYAGLAGDLDHPRRRRASLACPRPTVRGAAAAAGPQLRPGRRRTAHG